MSADWIDFLHEAGVFQTGSFRLKSGKESPYFMNFGRIDGGATLSAMGRYFAQALLDWDVQPDLLFGPAYKGLPMAVATVAEYYRLSGRDLAYASFRKEAKQHGDAGMVLGRAPFKGARIVMIDDVLTTSTTKVESIQQIERFTGSPPHIVGVLVGVDRMERTPAGSIYSQAFTVQTGIPVRSLTTTKLLLEGLYQRGRLDEATLQRCLETL